MQYRLGTGAEPDRFPTDFRVFTKEPGIVGDALRTLDQFGRRKHERTPAELLAELYDSWRGVAAALCEGQQVARETWRRVRYVIDEARAWSDATGGTLAEYLAWVDRRIDDVDRVELSTDEGEDSVRIMTIHAAKGLEFPITVVAGLGGADASNTRPRVCIGRTASRWFDSGSMTSAGSADMTALEAPGLVRRRRACCTSHSPAPRIISSSRCITRCALCCRPALSRGHRRRCRCQAPCAPIRSYPIAHPPSHDALPAPDRLAGRTSPTSSIARPARCAGSGRPAVLPKRSAMRPGRRPMSAWCRDRCSPSTTRWATRLGDEAVVAPGERFGAAVAGDSPTATITRPPILATARSPVPTTAPAVGVAGSEPRRAAPSTPSCSRSHSTIRPVVCRRSSTSRPRRKACSIVARDIEMMVQSLLKGESVPADAVVEQLPSGDVRGCAVR